MKFGQLLEYNMRNIFLEKFYTKCGGGTIHRHSRPLASTSYKDFFYKNKKWSGNTLPSSFSAWFLKKDVYLVTFL